MGKKKKESKPLTEEELEAKWKREEANAKYVRIYNRLHKDIMDVKYMVANILLEEVETMVLQDLRHIEYLDSLERSIRNAKDYLPEITNPNKIENYEIKIKMGERIYAKAKRYFDDLKTYKGVSLDDD